MAERQMRFYQLIKTAKSVCLKHYYFIAILSLICYSINIMIIDSHTHISVTTKGGNFELSKKKLLAEMKKNKIDKTIVIPDNISNPLCADMEAVIKLIKNEPKLLMVASLKIENINYKNIYLIKKLFIKKQN